MLDMIYIFIVKDEASANRIKDKEGWIYAAMTTDKHFDKITEEIDKNL